MKGCCCKNILKLKFTGKKHTELTASQNKTRRMHPPELMKLNAIKSEYFHNKQNNKILLFADTFIQMRMHSNGDAFK